MLMGSWVSGHPLSRVIATSINYYRSQGQITFNDWSRKEPWVTEAFDEKSPRHINLIIEWTLRDIDGGLRFRIISYLQNFYDLSVAALGQAEAGINVASLVEYGTTDRRAIQLQEVGFSRGVASELLAEYADYLTFSDSGELERIDDESLLAEQALGDDIRSELVAILSKQ
ncbi:hypothetical protein A5667_25560 [Mycolicibacterium fortuitum]|uniref:hypothetical protein n=1 Tax=Mycolicibacterium fortuitum TaxID=1766 RepID=UPI0007EDD3A5|nr:hypothetical protein [Mycolicibacterium fortuitum]OBI54307.1 hypothetical protein A5667_25560 [Mycolicibacterium fortuitum]